MSGERLGRAGDGGTWFPPFVDAHVHLGLVDPVAVRRGGIAVVHDLGWVPDVARTWPGRPGFPEVAFAGAFLTAPGGYPSDRSWAPPGSVEAVGSPEAAVAAVDRQVAVGVSFVKVALHADAGPVPDDVTLAALVGHAHARGRDVVAHVEGRGMAARAFEAGIDRLAHAPFSERLPDDLLAAMARPRPRPSPRPRSEPRPLAEHDPARRRARPDGRKGPDNDPQVVFGGSRVGWVSTLDVHGWGSPSSEQDVAIDNVRRFAALGGTVVYGTDLGNGPLPPGVNARELRALAAAGLDADALLAALTHDAAAERCVPGRALRPGTQHSSTDASLATWVPGDPPDFGDPDAVATWLARAVVVERDATHPAPPEGRP
ncbi:amidohydrolase [Cellulosimicrobium cellulans]|uniref:amidohydrolase n=1 Tax=Cellulosimicrobium cellulans TaxID=1710 RepID=UPI001ED9E0BC|nr:amidohydrolase [Cellulosimicrobium cellulans]UKJ62718.1 amidohydrolase [Cellulosimicrobium cellulans]